MELQGNYQKTMMKEIAGTTEAGAQMAGKIARGIQELFPGARQTAGEMLTHRLSKMLLGTRRRMRFG